MPRPRRLHVVVASMAATYALTVATAIMYRSRDTVPPRWDQAGHLLHALEYRDLLLAFRPLQFMWKHYAYYPPLVYQIAGALHAAFGPSRWVALAVMEAFALVLVIATYRLGRAFGGPRVGGLAAVCLLLLPIVTVFTREVSLDVPLVAMSTVVFALVAEGPLQSWRRSVGLGLAIGLGMLTKWSFALVAVAPVAWLACSAARQREGRRRRLARLAASLGIGAVLAGPWYVRHLGRLWTDSVRSAVTVAEREGDPAVTTLGSLSYYARMAAQEWFLLPLSLALVAATVGAVRRDRRMLHLLNLFVWPTYLLFALIPNKDPRYALPIAPALCVALSYGLLGIGRPMWRRLAVGSVAALLVVQHVASVIDVGTLSTRIHLCFPELGARTYEPADPPAYFLLRGGHVERCRLELTVYNPFSYFGRRPRQEDWRIAHVVERIGESDRVWPPPDDVHLNTTLLQYQAASAGRRIVWATRPEEASVVLWKAGPRPPVPEGAELEACEPLALPDGTQLVFCRTKAARAAQATRPPL